MQLISPCRSQLYAICNLLRHSRETLSRVTRIQQSDLDFKRPLVHNIDGSFCIGVQPLLYCTREEQQICEAYEDLITMILQENAPFADFANETPTLLASNFLISVVDFIGDLLLLYRCWFL